MISSEINHLLKLAAESHDVAKALADMGHARFSAAQSYYTIFYLAQAMLLTNVVRLGTMEKKERKLQKARRENHCNGLGNSWTQ